jgi:Protein of unknown function (DUF1673)
MITKISDHIFERLGWCPKVPTPLQSLTVLNNETASNASSQRRGIPERTESLNLYRNQVLLWAVFLTLVSIPFMAYFLTTDLTRLLLSVGTIAGLVIFAFFGRWLWNSLEMLEKGMTIKTGPGEYIILFLIAGAIPLSIVLIIAVLITITSYAGTWAFPSFAMGFTLIPWYVYILILRWEQKTGCLLMFNKKTRSFIAVRCSGNALH